MKESCGENVLLWETGLDSASPAIACAAAHASTGQRVALAWNTEVSVAYRPLSAQDD